MKMTWKNFVGGETVKLTALSPLASDTAEVGEEKLKKAIAVARIIIINSNWFGVRKTVVAAFVADELHLQAREMGFNATPVFRRLATELPSEYASSFLAYLL
jgi:hypothetical protein